jgi:hypothetical protein
MMGQLLLVNSELIVIFFFKNYFHLVDYGGMKRYSCKRLKGGKQVDQIKIRLGDLIFVWDYPNLLDKGLRQDKYY